MEYRNFDHIIKKMPRYLLELEFCPIISMDHERQELRYHLPRGDAGVYVLYEYGKPMYAGRSDRLSERLREHSRGEASATFAILLAKEKFHNPVPMTNRDLLGNGDFQQLFAAAKTRVRRMGFRAVGIHDPIEQTIFEVYVHLALKTQYNHFENH